MSMNTLLFIVSAVERQTGRSPNLMAIQTIRRRQFLKHAGELKVCLYLRMSVIPKAKTIFVHTSNILKWNRGSILANPSDEAAKCVETVLHCWHTNTAKKDLRTREELNVACELHRDKIPDSERPDISVTAKVFLATYDPEAVRQAVNRTLDRLGLTDIETLIVSIDPELSKAPPTDVPPCMDFPSAKISQGTAESLVKVWPILEEFVKSNKVFHLGVCDMSADEMELLFSSVKVWCPDKVGRAGVSCALVWYSAPFARAVYYFLIQR
nr:unnamed protein product [Spirometra erinaceieuropaei]